jgi:hypothetical protein
MLTNMDHTDEAEDIEPEIEKPERTRAVDPNDEKSRVCEELKTLRSKINRMRYRYKCGESHLRAAIQTAEDRRFDLLKRWKALGGEGV